MKMAVRTTMICAVRYAIPRGQAYLAARRFLPRNDCYGFVVLEYDARHSPTCRPVVKESTARRVILLYYSGLAMEGLGLGGQTTPELSVGGPPSHAGHSAGRRFNPLHQKEA
jgi:hypothetical protein